MACTRVGAGVNVGVDVDVDVWVRGWGEKHMYVMCDSNVMNCRCKWPWLVSNSSPCELALTSSPCKLAGLP